MPVYKHPSESRPEGLPSVKPLEIVAFTDEADGKRWDDFVQRHPNGTNYHRWGWKSVIENGLRWPTYYLAAVSGREIDGVLPIVWQKSRMFGSFLTSMPFLNAGGILAIDGPTEQQLLNEAVALCKRTNARYLELRHRELRNISLSEKTHKLIVTRPVSSDTERMFQELHHKVRTDIRKAIKSGLTSEVGSAECLDDFYPIFAQNMRDLGTPVYSRRFFQEILREFPHDTIISVVRHQKKAVASSFLTGFNGIIEAAWSSSLKEALPLKPNMLLYWQNLCVAGERGYRVFDFGRSTPGSGTHRFKMQWGGEETTLHWQYWVPAGESLPNLSPQNRKYQLAVRLWQNLPLFISNRLGPHVVRCLP